MDETMEKPSKYFWRWTIWSWVCVGVAVLIVMMGVTGGGSLTPWVIGAIAFAVIGGIGFGFVPRESLNQTKRPMTPGAQRKAAAKRAKQRRGEGGE